MRRLLARFRPLIVATAVVAGVLLVIGQVALVVLHPVDAGSQAAWGGTDECASPEDQADGRSCVGVPYRPGTNVGIVLYIRNNAPIAMTIERVAGLDRACADCPSPIAVLRPALPVNMDVPPKTRPFAPVVVEPGKTQEVALQGRMADCAALGVNAHTGGGFMPVDNTTLTVRWGLVPTNVSIPFSSVLELHAPEPGDCP